MAWMRRREAVVEGEPAREGRVGHGARRGADGLARLIELIASAVALVIVLGILLVVFKANQSNDLVNTVHDAARWLVGPFHGIFSFDNNRTEVAVNWGIAAVVYFLVGHMIARFLRPDRI